MFFKRTCVYWVATRKVDCNKRKFQLCDARILFIKSQLCGYIRVVFQMSIRGKPKHAPHSFLRLMRYVRHCCSIFLNLNEDVLFYIHDGYHRWFWLFTVMLKRKSLPRKIKPTQLIGVEKIT